MIRVGQFFSFFLEKFSEPFSENIGHIKNVFDFFLYWPVLAKMNSKIRFFKIPT